MWASEGSQLVPNKDHIAPVNGCSCGIYAKYRLEDIGTSDTGSSREVIFGAIDVYGNVIEGDEGVRAQKATIRGLWSSPFLGPTTLRGDIERRISDHYKIPFFRSDYELLEAFPPDKDIPLPPKIRERDWSLARSGGQTVVLGSGGQTVVLGWGPAVGGNPTPSSTIYHSGGRQSGRTESTTHAYRLAASYMMAPLYNKNFLKELGLG
jgi:hypothetical protein